jgi:hypothetical protein
MDKVQKPSSSENWYVFHDFWEHMTSAVSFTAIVCLACIQCEILIKVSSELLSRKPPEKGKISLLVTD